MDLDVFCRGCKFVNEGMLQIAEIERQKLSYTPTFDEQNAGIEKDNKLTIRAGCIDAGIM